MINSINMSGSGGGSNIINMSGSGGGSNSINMSHILPLILWWY